MNNLKRVLSLGLAGTMLAGMMMVGAGAASTGDFTDKEEITHTEAVKIATALSIIDGNDDGSFNPAGEVTRGQMAKMITRAMYGGSDPVLGTKVTPSFTDIKGRWDESYIEYCYSAGIINGRGDGTFDPEGKVTGSEAAKMLLSALGYDTEVYGFTGIDWSINTNKIANSIDAKLYDGLRGIDPSVALDRDSTAQMVYNALNAKTKEMVPTTSTNGTIEYTYTNGDTLLYAKYGAVRVEGVVTGNEFTSNSESMKGKTYVAITNNDELTNQIMGKNYGSVVNFSANFDVESGKEEFGRAVIVYAKPSAASPRNMAKAEVICEVILDDDNNAVATTTKGFGSGKNIYDFAKDNGMKLEDYDATAGAHNAAFYTNYANVGPTAMAGAGDVSKFGYYGASTFGTANKYAYTNSIGTEIIMIDNDADGIVDVVLQNVYDFGQVTKYSTKDDGSVSVRTGGSLGFSNEELKNIVAYEGIAKDDYVTVTKVDDTYYLEKAKVVTGNLDAFKRESGAIKNVTVDGETFDKSAVATYAGTESLAGVTTTNISNTSLNNDGDFYLDHFGYVVAIDLVAASAYAYIGSASYSDAATSFSPGTLQVYAVLEDGTAASYTVSKYYNSSSVEQTIDSVLFTSAKLTAMAGDIYKYALDGEGRIKLTEIAVEGTADTFTANKQTDTAAGTVEYTKGQATFQTNVVSTVAKTVITDNNTVFFYAFEKKSSTAIDSVEVYVGKDNAPSVKGNPLKTTVVMNKDGDKAAAIIVTTKAVATSNYMYVIDYLFTNNDGDVYQVWKDGEVTEITTNGAESTRYVGAYTYTTTAKNLYNLKTPELVTTGAATLVEGNALVVNGHEFTLKDAEVVLIDGKDSAETSVGKWDTVVVVYDRASSGKADLAQSVYVVEEYSEENTGATLNTGATNIRQSADDDNLVVFDVKSGATISAILNSEVTFPYNYTAGGAAYFIADGSKPTTAAGALTAASSALTTLSDPGSGNTTTIWLVVVSEDGLHFSTYKTSIVSATDWA